jgi:formate hydrogenlyase subunit 3/multisubunit Na+/H+ antiporter MnhD subunit
MILATIATAVPVSTTSSIISAISTVGFPIVACGALFWYIQKENTSNRDKIDKLSDTINANTAVMDKLLERLDKVA